MRYLILFLSALLAASVNGQQAMLMSGMGTVPLAAEGAPGGGSALILGYTNNTVALGGVSGRQQSCPFALATPGTLTNIAVYCAGTNTTKVSVAIHLPSGADLSRPGTVVATNVAAVDAPSSAGWVNLAMPDVALVATNYFLTMWGSSSITNYTATATGTNTYAGASTTWPQWSTFAFNAVQSNKVLVIYGQVVP